MHEPRFRAARPTLSPGKARFTSTVTCSCGEFSKSATSASSADSAKVNARRRWVVHLDAVAAAESGGKVTAFGCVASVVVAAIALVLAVGLAVGLASWATGKAFPDYCYTQAQAGHRPTLQSRHVCDGRARELPESAVR